MYWVFLPITGIACSFIVTFFLRSGAKNCDEIAKMAEKKNTLLEYLDSYLQDSDTSYPKQRQARLQGMSMAMKSTSLM